MLTDKGGDRVKPGEKAKDKIYELRKRLESVVIPGNLHSEAVLEISRELDVIILESYLYNTKD